MPSQPVASPPDLQLLIRPDGATIAYHRLPRKPGGPRRTGMQRSRRAAAEPGIVFLGGFRSDMTGTKALALESACRDAGRPFVRFDYRGHGRSTGLFEAFVLSDWIDDGLQVLDGIAEGPQVLVGSSMGGWIMLHLALRRPERVAGLVGIAPAPDFTEDLMWERFSPAERERLVRDGKLSLASEYSPEPTVITRSLIADGRKHLLLRSPIAIRCPVRLLHGMADPDVPWETSPRLAAALTEPDVEVLLVKDGDHRLSRPEDIERLLAAVGAVAARAAAQAA